MELISNSAQETKNIARRLAHKITAKIAGKKAIVITLKGELGAGKTTFVQGFAEALGIKQTTKSPTFVLMKDYQAGNFQMYHLDCYRISSPEEIASLELKQLFKEPKNIILIEWPERISKIIPKNAVRIRFNHLNENTRKISVSGTV